MPDRRHLTALGALLVAASALLLTGCPGGGGSGGSSGGTVWPEWDVADFPKPEDYEPPAFPETLPFDPAEWETAADYPSVGDPRAIRDWGKTDRGEDKSVFTIPWTSYPPTLRTDGPNSNLVQTSQIHGLMYESLVQIHPETEQFIPCLATHWKIENNRDGKSQTFWFRIDPRARWADGSEVTADDVHKSWWHRVQEDRQEPSNLMTFRDDFEEPEVLDKYTVRVRTKELNWRLFLYFGGMSIYPAKYVYIPGKRYLEEYNWQLWPGTGPYALAKAGLKKGDSMMLVRRKDWWAENEPWAKHTFNFELVKFIVVREIELQYEMLKKRELDYYVVGRAQRWVEDVPKESVVKKGWVKRRKIYNQSPTGFSGIAFNMRERPFDDKRVRLAFAYLFNREKLMEKLFFNEYEYTDSYFPARDWGNAQNEPVIRFDPDRAEQLLAEAGYKERDDEGYLLGPGGERFSVALKYGHQSWERIWLVVQEDYRDAGIEFNLELVDYSSLLKLISERKFKIHFQSWGALLFPNPETSWHSRLADQDANNNIPGFKNARVDELCDLYNRVLERAKQKEITREIDRIVYAEHPYALAWHANFTRVLFWDIFGYPDTYLTRTGQVPSSDMLLTWWIDPERREKLAAARKTGTELPQGEVVVRPWDGK